MTDSRTLATTPDDSRVPGRDDGGTGLLATLRRSWATFGAAPVPYLAIAFASSLWVAATGLPGGTPIAASAGFGLTWLTVLEAGSKRRAALPAGERIASLIPDMLVWAISIMAAYGIGTSVFTRLSALPQVVRVWLSVCAGLATWAAICSFYWPTFSQPKFSEYETFWLGRATTVGVALGGVRALTETLGPAAPSTVVPVCSERPDIFGNATDTVSRATFGLALFGAVFFLALWGGGRVGRGTGRKFWPARHRASS